MNCIECGSELSIRMGTYDYESLPGTVLTNVEFRRCSSCGEEEIVLPHLAQLDRVLAGVVIRHARPLLPAEFRFLRKLLGWSGVDLARRFGVTKETVSRWENGHKRIRPIADQYLRLLVAHEAPIADYRAHDLEPLTEQPGAAPAPIEIRRLGNGWQAHAA